MQAFGDTYKWMLYGDDDTMFFAEGIQNLVKDIDPNMPYFITGKVLCIVCYSLYMSPASKEDFVQ